LDIRPCFKFVERGEGFVGCDDTPRDATNQNGVAHTGERGFEIGSGFPRLLLRQLALGDVLDDAMRFQSGAAGVVVDPASDRDPAGNAIGAQQFKIAFPEIGAGKGCFSDGDHDFLTLGGKETQNFGIGQRSQSRIATADAIMRVGPKDFLCPVVDMPVADSRNLLRIGKTPEVSCKASSAVLRA